MSEADQPRPSSLITFASPIGYSEGWTRESLAVEVERRASSAGVMRYSGGSCASATRRSICASSAVLNSSGGRRASRLRFISRRRPRGAAPLGGRSPPISNVGMDLDAGEVVRRMMTECAVAVSIEHRVVPTPIRWSAVRLPLAQRPVTRRNLQQEHGTMR